MRFVAIAGAVDLAGGGKARQVGPDTALSGRRLPDARAARNCPI